MSGLEAPTIQKTRQAVDGYLEWWKTQPKSQSQSIAIRQHAHTRRRLDLIIRDLQDEPTEHSNKEA